MTLARGLALPEYLLRISSVQVHEALGPKNGSKADQECDQANIDPGEAHEVTPNRQIPVNVVGFLMLEQYLCQGELEEEFLEAI